MKGYNGLEIREGCVLCFPSWHNIYRKVEFITEEKDRFTCGERKSSIKKVLNCTGACGVYWTQKEIRETRAYICTYKPLGVYDCTGKEIHDQDEIMDGSNVKHKVWGGVEGGNPSTSQKAGFIMVRGDKDGGWYGFYGNKVGVVSRPTDEKEEDVVEVIIKRNGKVISERKI